MKHGFVAGAVAYYDTTIERHKHYEASADHCIRPGHQQDGLNVGGLRQEVQHKEQQPLPITQRQRHLGSRWFLIPLLGVLRPPGLFHPGCCYCGSAKCHPDHVSLAEEDGTDAQGGRGLVAAVQRHEVGEEDEEGGAGICVVEEVEEVEHREGGQGECGEDAVGRRACLQKK